jgi:hypothetical protein
VSPVRLQLLDKTIHYQQKREVVSLVSRLLAEWVVPGAVARMLPEVHGLQRLQYLESVRAATAKTYMERSDGLPAVELPGVQFRLQGKLVFGGRETREWMLEQRECQ